MLGTILWGGVLAAAYIVCTPLLATAGAWGTEAVGWYHLSPHLRLLLILSALVCFGGALTVMWPRYFGKRKMCIQQISPEEFEEQKRQYTQKCLDDLHKTSDYVKFQRAVASKRIISSFQENQSSDDTSLRSPAQD